MPRTIRFHLDETCRGALARDLRLRGIDVTTSRDAGLIGASDRDQLGYAHAEGRVLFTHDTDFSALHRAGIEHAGIIYCHQRRYAIGEMIRRLALYWEVYDSA